MINQQRFHLLLLLPNHLKKSQPPPLLVRHLLLHPFFLSSSSSSHFSSNNNSYLSSTHPSSSAASHFLKPYSSSSSIRPYLHPKLSHYPTLTDFQFQEKQEIDDDDDDDDDDRYKNPSDKNTHLFIKILRQANSDEHAMDFIYKSSIKPTESLICSVIWELRNEWELGFLAFKWGLNSGCFSNTNKVWILMIWVLGKQRQFGVAWSLIRKMVPSSLDSRKALLIMIQSYAAAGKPNKAIQTFQAMEKFRVTADSKAFHTLLRVLCTYGDVELAEEFMLTNKKLFPLEIESFNIILDGWSNFDEVEAKRVWREMSNCCITPNAVSYTHMISCFSKVGNLFDSLRLYDQMKKRGWFPGISVYNSLIYVLTRENCLKDALNLLEKIKEVGLKADSATYSSIIIPLCEAKKSDEARIILADMIREGLGPTTATYHAFVEVEESLIGTSELLRQMKETGCGPNGNTFLLIFNKFFKFHQSANVLKMWMEMKRLKIIPNSAHYNVVVAGLAKFGWMKKAREIYDEMKTLGFAEDPKLKKLFQGCGKK
ncbi:hypothetical protein MKW98_025009 [Papaver atlanticum]|uniref:Pentatricopeptide repeat-containing protein n=1 Tax=Papaver atlanticum TaxID=357466 RepID=A0AAD4XM79_9MAGN|nr:hypothetical protein MKW98_025009 [Papaver atlanticum]